MAKRIITALDIGSSKICTIIATVSDTGDKPQVIGVYSHPSAGVKKGVIVNIDEAINATSESLAAAERMAGVTVSSAYVSISGSHITSINSKGVVAVGSTTEEISEEDTYRAIENARTISIPPSRDILHIIPREFIVDSQGGIKDPVGMSGSRLEVDTHIISATTTSLQNLVKVVGGSGLDVEDIVFAGWASSHAVLTDTEKELGVALLDMGGGTTSICIFQEGAISYSGCVPLGGINITSDIAIGLQISLEDSERLKLNFHKLSQASQRPDRTENLDSPAIDRKKKEEEGENDKPVKDPDLVDISSLNIKDHDTISKNLFNQIVEARLEEIFEMISNQVGQAGFDVAMPAGVVLAGGCANLPDITKVTQNSFGVPARVGNPSDLTGMIEEVTGPDFAAAHGLIKHAVMEDVESSPSPSSRDFRKGGGLGIISKIQEWIKSLLP